MKKLVKKIVVAVLAMAMAIGMLAVSASAATDPGKLYVVGGMNGWKFEEMEKVDGIYTKTYTGLEAGSTVEFKFTLQADWKDEISPVGGGNLSVVVPEDGQVTFTVDFSKLPEPVANGDNLRYEVSEDLFKTVDNQTAKDLGVAVNAGDKAPYVAIAAVAVLALGAVVVLASKKKIVTE